MNNICFNERQNIWTTRYDWTPTISENINGVFYSIEGLGSDNTVKDGIWTHSVLPEFNQPVQPTNWFNEQHVFEFEFVVSTPQGVQKIFDNLQIISNNTQPDELEITIIGDDYIFNRKEIDGKDVRTGGDDKFPVFANQKPDTTSNIHYDRDDKNPRDSHDPHGEYKYDRRLKQYALTKWQPIKDIYDYGRRIGNTQYKDGIWYTQIEPLLDPKTDREIRIRDKWARIRIRYSGKDLAVITAIGTIMNI